MPSTKCQHHAGIDENVVVVLGGFLKEFGLENDFKINIEVNHATLAGHTFEHELQCAVDAGMLGAIDANRGDVQNGWDTDQFPTNVYDATLCMYEVLKAGGFTNGGLNFDSKTRRSSNTFEDIILSYIAGMDTFALGLRKAVAMIEDGRIDSFVDERYASFNSGIGKKIVDKSTSLEELTDYAMGLGAIEVMSGRQEYLENVLNNIMFNN